MGDRPAAGDLSAVDSWSGGGPVGRGGDGISGTARRRGRSSCCGDRRRRSSRGSFGRCRSAPRNDEIQDLTHSINHMVERLARYEADVRLNERLRTLGQLGAGIAHQMRNAATGARLALDLHRQECPLDPDCETLEVAKRQFTLMETYLQRFLTLGRGETLSREVARSGR